MLKSLRAVISSHSKKGRRQDIDERSTSKEKVHGELQLEFALYARPKHPGSYHWALFISPIAGSDLKDEIKVSKHHVKNTILVNDSTKGLINPWRYENIEISNMTTELNLLARVVFARVLDSTRLRSILLEQPVLQNDEVSDGQTFSCVTWVRDAVTEVSQQQGVISRMDGDWESLSRRAIDYVEQQKAQGRWRRGWTGPTEIPVFDLMAGKELVK